MNWSSFMLGIFVVVALVVGWYIFNRILMRLRYGTWSAKEDEDDYRNINLKSKDEQDYVIGQDYGSNIQWRHG